MADVALKNELNEALAVVRHRHRQAMSLLPVGDHLLGVRISLKGVGGKVLDVDGHAGIGGADKSAFEADRKRVADVVAHTDEAVIGELGEIRAARGNRPSQPPLLVPCAGPGMARKPA